MLAGAIAFICDIACTFQAAGATLITVMFIYGGLRYVYGADDPGTRKQAKSICINALVGGILIALAGTAIVQVGTNLNLPAAPGNCLNC